MTLFEWLLVSHLAGDWLLQTEWQAQNKATSWRAMLTHIVIYHAVMLVALIALVGADEPRIYVVIVFLAITHLFMDRQWPVARLMSFLRLSVERTPERWFSIAIDQVLHIILLAVCVVYLTSS